MRFSLCTLGRGMFSSGVAVIMFYLSKSVVGVKKDVS